MARLLLFFFFVVLIYIAYRVLCGIMVRRPTFKCSTCRHCGRLDEDGVICRFGDKETFKNPIHILNCMDFEDDPRIPRRR